MLGTDQAASGSHLFEVILPPLVTVGDVQGVQVFQRTSVISEGHLGYPLQDLVQLLLTLSLDKRHKQGTAVMHTAPRRRLTGIWPQVQFVANVGFTREKYDPRYDFFEAFEDVSAP